MQKKHKNSLFIADLNKMPDISKLFVTEEESSAVEAGYVGEMMVSSPCGEGYMTYAPAGIEGGIAPCPSNSGKGRFLGPPVKIM